MTFTILLVAGPLLGLGAVFLVLWLGRASEPLGAPATWLAHSGWAALAFAGANAVILSVTALVGLGLAPYGGFTLAVVCGPMLSVLAWIWFGRRIPPGGARRLGIALSGSLPYWLAVAAAWVWLGRAEAAAGPGDDLFHAWLGAMILTAVAFGATVVSAAVVTFSGRK